MKNGTLMIEGFQFDPNGNFVFAETWQRNWQGHRWMTIAKINVSVDLVDDRVVLLSSKLDGEEITEIELMSVLNFRAAGATSQMIDEALAQIYFDNKKVAYC